MCEMTGKRGAGFLERWTVLVISPFNKSHSPFPRASLILYLHVTDAKRQSVVFLEIRPRNP